MLATRARRPRTIQIPPPPSQKPPFGKPFNFGSAQRSNPNWNMGGSRESSWTTSEPPHFAWTFLACPFRTEREAESSHEPGGSDVVRDLALKIAPPWREFCFLSVRSFNLDLGVKESPGFSRARKPWSANCELKHWNFRGRKCLIHGLHFTV